jgi:hypothetical protein
MGRVTISALAATAVGVLVLAGIALGSGKAKQGATLKAPISIKSLVDAHQSSDGTYRGRFVLVLNHANEDSGTNFIRPGNGPLKTVDGQVQEPIFAARSFLTGKRGTLALLFRGVSVTVNNIDPAKEPSGIEYGTWQITAGTGMYKGWKGGGRWATSFSPTANNVQWDGYVTR